MYINKHFHKCTLQYIVFCTDLPLPLQQCCYIVRRVVQVSSFCQFFFFSSHKSTTGEVSRQKLLSAVTPFSTTTVTVTVITTAPQFNLHYYYTQEICIQLLVCYSKWAENDCVLNHFLSIFVIEICFHFDTEVC